MDLYRIGVLVMFRNFAMIDKETNTIINVIVVDWNYVFTDDYIWVDTERYPVGVGDLYIDDRFYKADDLEQPVIQNKTEQEQLQSELNFAQHRIATLSTENTELEQTLSMLLLDVATIAVGGATIE